jgi:ABC-2 type transport system permease protein
VRLFVAGLRKLIRRPATYITFILLILLLGLILVSIGATARQSSSQQGGELAILLITFPAAYSFVLSFILGLGGLFAVIYGAAIAGSEWSWGTLKSAVARGESRSRYQLVSAAAMALMLGVGLVAAYALGIVLMVVGDTIGGISTAGLNDAATLGTLPELLARGWLAIVEQAALGFAIATLARSQLAGIATGIGVYFVEQFSTIFLPDIVKYLPFHVAGDVVAVSGGGSFGGGGGAAQALEPNTALLLVAAWLVGALVVTAVFTERAEISG